MPLIGRRAERTRILTFEVLESRTLLSGNTPPTISNIADHSTPKNTTSAAIGFIVGDAETTAESLVVTAVSSDTTLVPNSYIVLGGSGAERTIALTPAANLMGPTTITITVTDADGAIASETFVLTVHGVIATSIGAGSTVLGTFEGHTFAVMEDGTVRTWGANNEGQLGDGNTTPRTTSNKYDFDSDVPIQVPGITNAVAMAGGFYHTVVLLEDGTLRAWGNNRYGQLGDGTTAQSFTPVEVRTASGQLLTGVVEIAAGDYHTVARRNDGTVWSWGWNAFGQLGNGTDTNSSYPVQVMGLTLPATALTARFRGSAVILTDGTMRTWGDNEGGQLGDGNDTGHSNIPVTPAYADGNPIRDAVALDAGDHHNMVVLANGEIWAWGRNAEGQLGDGTSINSPRPVRVQGVSNAIAVTGGDIHSGALLADLTAISWGRNVAGELGTGQIGQKATAPVAVLNLQTFASLVAGGLSTHGLLADGTVWGWGQNRHGQLGDGNHGVINPGGTTGRDQVHSSVPVQVIGIGSPTGNSKPILSDITDQTTDAGMVTGAIQFMIGDAETAVSALSVTGGSSNQSLVPNGNIIFSGSGANRIVTITPTPGQIGNVTITIVVADADRGMVHDTFVLTVNPHPPMLAGDYNLDGTVNSADYILWRKNPAAFGNGAGYNTWQSHYGETAGGGGAAERLEVAQSQGDVGGSLAGEVKWTVGEPTFIFALPALPWKEWLAVSANVLATRVAPAGGHSAALLALLSAWDAEHKCSSWGELVVDDLDEPREQAFDDFARLSVIADAGEQ